MRNTQHMLHRMIAVGLVLGLALFGVISCDQGDESSSPSGINPITYSNFDVQGAVSNEYGVNKGDGYFQVNVPEAGDYRLTYTTELGTFYLLFRAEGGALLTIGLTQYADGTYDEVSEVSLETGAIAEDGSLNAGNMSIVVIGIVTVYSWQDNHGNPIPWQGPGGSNPQNSQAVTFTSQLVIILITGGQVQSSSGSIVIIDLSTILAPPTNPGGGGGGGGPATPTCAGDGGVEVGGACWFLGVGGQSCTAVCGANANFVNYDAATLSYAGSGGNDGNCITVLNALLNPDPTFNGNGVGEHAGCVAYNSGANGFRYTDATTAGASVGGEQRACACSM